MPDGHTGYTDRLTVVHNYSTGPKGTAAEDLLYLHDANGDVFAVGSVERVRALLAQWDAMSAVR